jgi:large subunit ribosomal protein L35
LDHSTEGRFVPKLKAHRGAAKRFKRTGTGKLVRHHAFARHILTSKSKKRKRALRKDTVVDKSELARLNMMLPK